MLDLLRENYENYLPDFFWSGPRDYRHCTGAGKKYDPVHFSIFFSVKSVQGHTFFIIKKHILYLQKISVVRKMVSFDVVGKISNVVIFCRGFDSLGGLLKCFYYFSISL